MSQQQQQQQQPSFYYDQSASLINHFSNYDCNIIPQHEELEVSKLPKTGRDCTNFYVELLHKETLTQRSGEPSVIRVGGRKNKNEVLGLVNQRLLKEKYLNGKTYSRNVELLRDIQMNSNSGEFLLVLRTDGRVIAMSEEAEYNLGKSRKSMRSLYTQLINIFECLDDVDGEKLRSIFNDPFALTHPEYSLVCTLRLPKGKRPGRANQDVTTIAMAGHFFQCDESPSSEKLFVARCEALLSPTAKGSSSSQTITMVNSDNSKSILNITLNEDMSINTVSSNVRTILGYTKNEMIGNWLGRYLATNDLQKFETVLQRFFQHEQQQKALPTSICEVFDMYTNNGDGRLTFLCQIRSKRQRRLRSVQFVVVAQLIDPSLRDEYVKYVQSKSDKNSMINNAEQVNLGTSSVSETRQDTIMAHSPSLAMGLLMFDNTRNNDSIYQQEYSPFNRSLSNVVAPVNIDDESFQQLLDFDYNQYPTTPTDFLCWPTDFSDSTFNTCQSEQELASVFDEYIGTY